MAGTYSVKHVSGMELNRAMKVTEPNQPSGNVPAETHFTGPRLAGLIAWPLLSALLLMGALTFGIFKLLDYYYWAKPNSTMGSVVQAEDLIAHQLVSGKRNVIVMGDSRVGEGFSSALASASIDRKDLNFVAAGVPGTPARVWFYLLRKVDPQQKNFAAVVLMVPRLDDAYEPQDLRKVQDLTYLQPVTGFQDVATIAEGAPDHASRVKAIAEMLLPVLSAREDLTDFAAHPKQRAHEARIWHASFYKNVAVYGGHPSRLPDLLADQLTSFDFSKTSMSAADVNNMKNYVDRIEGRGLYATPELTGSYHTKWYGAIADEYRRAGIPVFVFQVPRGPYERFAKTNDATMDKGSIPTLAREGKLTVLDPAPFEALEQPRYFFDALHVNTAGRLPFSATLAHLVAQQLPESH